MKEKHSKLYETISNRLNEVEDILKEAKERVSRIEKFVKEEMIDESKICEKKLYLDIFQIANYLIRNRNVPLN